MRVLFVNTTATGAFNDLVAIEGDWKDIEAFSKKHSLGLVWLYRPVQFKEIVEGDNFKEWIADAVRSHKGITLVEDTLEESLHMLRRVSEAMDETKKLDSCWWSDPKVENVLSYGVNAGWLLRPSASQIEWTQKGVDLFGEHSYKVLDLLREKHLANGDSTDMNVVKMIDAIKGQMTNQTYIWEVACWIHSINSASTIQLRDFVCRPHYDLFDGELDWFNAFARMDSARSRALDEKETQTGEIL